MNFTPSLKPGVTWIHVLSSTGESSGHDGTSSSITNSSDRALLLNARKQADWILVSADTFIAEHYKPSKHAPLAVISRDTVKRQRVLEQLRETDSSADREPVAVFDSIESFFEATNSATDSKILLESGRTMTAALASGGRINNSLVTVIGRLTDKGAQAIATLCRDLGIEPNQYRHVHTEDELNVWVSNFPS
jgi:riboflavin biosynthesis pyrimidine reductase